MRNVFFENKQKYVVTKFDNENLSHLSFVLNFLKKYFYNAFYNVKDSIIRNGPELTAALDNGFFIEDENKKKVGCVLFGPKSCNVPLVDYKQNTLFIHYLMVSENYRNKGLASKLIRSVIDYAKANNYDYIELLSNKHLFETRGNVYEHNNFNKISMYDSIQNPFKKNIVFRFNTNEFITNISNYIFAEMKKKGLSKIDEQALVENLNNLYGDIIKSNTDNLEFNSGLKENLKKYKSNKNAKKISLMLKVNQTLAIVPILKKTKYNYQTYSNLIKVFDSLDDLSKNKKIENSLASLKNKNM